MRRLSALTSVRLRIRSTLLGWTLVVGLIGVAEHAAPSNGPSDDDSGEMFSMLCSMMPPDDATCPTTADFLALSPEARATILDLLAGAAIEPKPTEMAEIDV